MKYYRSYMARQEISRETHERLLELKARRRPARSWVKYGALAACAALIVGVGMWRLAPAPGPAPTLDSTGQFAPDYTPLPGETDTVIVEPEYSFVVSSPTESGKLMFPMVPYIDYSNTPPYILDGHVFYQRDYPPGSFTVDLTKEDIQTIFWGPEGKPEAIHPKVEQGDLPWMLFWDGYTVRGSAWYDGQGRLMELTILGELVPSEQVRADFKLELCPGDMPFICDIGYCIDGLSEFNGVSIAGWSDSYGLTVNGERDYTYACGSEFMTADKICVRFENAGILTGAEDGEAEDMELDWGKTFNALFVRQAIVGGLYLDHLMTAEYVPAWREESFSSLDQARQVAEFAPYLPARDPEDYSAYAGNKEFSGHLSYQEGVKNSLFVRWYRRYDGGYVRIYVCVYRDGYDAYQLADLNDPASYDVRLYDIPPYDSPAFRAEDMSLSIVEARGIGKDAGYQNFDFQVIHPDGTAVSYRCDGVSAQAVWEMVEETL